jgi:hypothetical protein
MTNPVALERTMTVNGKPGYRSIWTFCPGCQLAHPFRIELFGGCPPRKDGSTEPTWEWDGNLEAPTFSPSMLAYGSVHLCAGEHPPVRCTDPACTEPSHIIENHDTPEEYLAHRQPHTRDPAWGNCHSFLKAGRWEFLGDSAHALAGQTVPMVPLPDWLV